MPPITAKADRYQILHVIHLLLHLTAVYLPVPHSSFRPIPRFFHKTLSCQLPPKEMAQQLFRTNICILLYSFIEKITRKQSLLFVPVLGVIVLPLGFPVTESDYYTPAIFLTLSSPLLTGGSAANIKVNRASSPI